MRVLHRRIRFEQDRLEGRFINSSAFNPSRLKIKTVVEISIAELQRSREINAIVCLLSLPEYLHSYLIDCAIFFAAETVAGRG